MKIFAINPLKFNIFNQRTNIENNQYDYSQNRKPVLSQLKADSVTFSGKIPSIVTPTMEDLINKTKAVDVLRFNILRLAKYGIPCPCCGHIMLDVDKFNKFEEKVLGTTAPGEILKYIGELKQYLHPVESKIYSMMVSKHHENQNMTLHDMLRSKLPRAERKIIHEQSRIFTNIGIMSRNLPADERENVNKLLQETYSRILDKRETSRFSRMIFIEKLKTLLLNEPPVDYNDLNSIQKVNFRPIAQVSQTARDIIAEAVKLPMAYNNPDAFIVKYAKRNYGNANPDQKIALRMLSNSLATIEHIKPSKLKGDTSPDNLALECAGDNNRRRHSSIISQIVENPQMIINYPRYLTRLVELHKSGKLEKNYIKQTNKTYSSLSLGILDADLTELNRPFVRKKTKTKSGITPTKAERRAKRKENLKLKLQKKSKSRSKSKPKY